MRGSDDSPACLTQLPALGVAASSISFTTVSMESDKCVCVRETATQPGGQNSVVIVDTTSPGGGAPVRRPITADSALMSPGSRVIALKVAQPGTQVDQLQVRRHATRHAVRAQDADQRVACPVARVCRCSTWTPNRKSRRLPCPSWWRSGSGSRPPSWAWSPPARCSTGARRCAPRAGPPAPALPKAPAPGTRRRDGVSAQLACALAPRTPPLSLPTTTGPGAAAVPRARRLSCPGSDLCPSAPQGDSAPVKVFDRSPGLQGCQIINYRASPDHKWLVLVGIAPGAPEVRSCLEHRLRRKQSANHLRTDTPICVCDAPP